MSGTDGSGGGSPPLALLLGLVGLGALSVALIWSAMNALSQNEQTSTSIALGLAGLLVLAVLAVWLWRYLNSLLPESQRRRRRIGRGESRRGS